MINPNPTTMTATKLVQAEFARIERRLELERKVFGFEGIAARATDCLLVPDWGMGASHRAVGREQAYSPYRDMITTYVDPRL